jgi:hypothetical protein
VGATDVQKTLKFGTGFYNAVLLAVFVVCAPLTAWFENWWMLALCIVGALFQLGRVILAQPALALTPDGIAYNYDGISYAIPWLALLNVETRDIPSAREASQIYKDTTVLTVSRKFYEEHIHSAFGVLLNPSRSDYFNFTDNKVQIALHHGFMRLEPKYLRGEVEARWRAFAPARAAKADAAAATAERERVL